MMQADPAQVKCSGDSKASKHPFLYFKGLQSDHRAQHQTGQVPREVPVLAPPVKWGSSGHQQRHSPRPCLCWDARTKQELSASLSLSSCHK